MCQKQLLKNQKIRLFFHDKSLTYACHPALTVSGLIMLTGVRNHPPKAHSEPWKTLPTAQWSEGVK